LVSVQGDVLIRQGVVKIKTQIFGVLVLMISLLFVHFASAAYDPECVSDADCWARSLGKAAGVQYTPTSCNDFCIENHGLQSSGKIVNNVCQCQCNPGFKEDLSLICVRSESSCNQDCKNYHAGRIYGANAYGTIINGVCECKCQEGYEPNENLACVEVFSENDFDGINDDDPDWQTFISKCGNLREFTRGTGDTFTVTQQEYINYITRVEEANPGASWKQILAALHVNRYPDDAFHQRLPGTNISLFEWGPETDGWRDVDLLCKEPLRSVSNPDWYTPKFVVTKNGRMIEMGHAYGGLRVGLNRESGIIGKTTNMIYGRDAEADLWVLILTHYGDAWQVLIHNTILREPGSRAPPDQLFGNNLGIWLANYYRKNPDAPLSEAFKKYFEKDLWGIDMV
jgi:hypothetical protein